MTIQQPANIPLNTFQDLLDALDRRPELRDKLWHRLVPPEILNLPIIVEEIRARQSRMEQDIIQIKERQERMEAALNRNTRELTDLKGMFTGSRYETKAARNLLTISRAAGLRRLKPLFASNMPNDQELMAKLEDAVDRNLITEENSEEIENADLVAQARDRATQDWVYLVAEASITAHTHDVNRAVRRARLLRQATGTHAIPAIISAQISDEVQQLADQENAVAIRLGA